jgi:hypothetical protein
MKILNYKVLDNELHLVVSSSSDEEETLCLRTGLYIDPYMDQVGIDEEIPFNHFVISRNHEDGDTVVLLYVSGERLGTTDMISIDLKERTVL